MRKLCFILCLTLSAETKMHKLGRFSRSFLIGAVTADVVSSWGGRELNPLLRSSNGNFGMRGAAVKYGTLGAALLTLRLTKKENEKAVIFGQIASAGFLTGIAVRNTRIK